MADSHPIENWRPVVGYEGLYEVSDLGRVRSLDHYTEFPNRYGGTTRIFVPGKTLKPKKSRGGYLQVSLRQPGNNKKVHRLVLGAFVGPPPTSRHEGAHKDGVRNNNCARNLAWVTKLENESHKLLHGTLLRGSIHPVAKLNESAAAEIKASIAAGAKDSELARRYKVARGTINDIRKGKTWKHVAQQH